MLSNKKRPTACIGISICLVGVQIGCGGSTTAPSSVSSTPSNLTTGLTAIQSQIFTPKCAGCHGNAVQQAGLNLASGSTFSSLVNVKSSQTTMTLVVPGNPNDSYLIHKLEDRAGIVGERMPKGGPFLTTDEVATITDWITAGALDN